MSTLALLVAVLFGLAFVLIPGALAYLAYRHPTARGPMTVAIAADESRRQDDLHRLARTAADRARTLCGLAELREESAERHDEIAGLEPNHADTHRAAAVQARDRAPHDRELPGSLPRNWTPPPRRDTDHTDASQSIADGAAPRDREVNRPPRVRSSTREPQAEPRRAQGRP